MAPSSDRVAPAVLTGALAYFLCTLRERPQHDKWFHVTSYEVLPQEYTSKLNQILIRLSALWKDCFVKLGYSGWGSDQRPWNIHMSTWMGNLNYNHYVNFAVPVLHNHFKNLQKFNLHQKNVDILDKYKSNLDAN